MTNFSKEELNAIRHSANEIKEAQPSGLSTNDYLQGVLMERIDKLSHSDAAAIIDRMESTIREYNINYNRGAETENIPVEGMLLENILSKGMTDQEAIRYLASTIVLLQNSRLGVSDLTTEELRKQVEDVIGEREICDATMQAMLKEAAASIQSVTEVAVDDEIAAAIATAPLDPGLIVLIREQAQNPLYMSVAAYLAIANGEVDAGDTELSPESVALGVATGTKIQELNADLSEGRIDLPTWVKCVKVAIGVCLAIMLLALFLGSALLWSVSMVSLGLSPVLAGILAGYLYVNPIIDLSVKGGFSNVKSNYSIWFDNVYRRIYNLCKGNKEAISGTQTVDAGQHTIQQSEPEVTEATKIETEVVSETTPRLVPGL